MFESGSVPHLFQPEFENKLRALARSTINTRTNGGVYRNVLMYGPPGTGKTMFAKVDVMICLCIQCIHYSI